MLDLSEPPLDFVALATVWRPRDEADRRGGLVADLSAALTEPGPA